MESLAQTTTTINTLINLDYVEFYHQRGFNVLPIIAGTKRPALSEWEIWQTQRQELEDLQQMNFSGGIGGILGIKDISQYDFDYCTDYGVVCLVLKACGLPLDYQWVVRTGNGYQVWFRCPEKVIINGEAKSKYDLKPRDEKNPPFAHLELRLRECYSVLPPTIHPNGKPYEWVNGLPQYSPITLAAEQVIKGFLLLTKASESRQTKGTILRLPVAPVSKVSIGYALAALQNELGILRDAQKGTRNTQLNKSAYALGQLVGSGLLEEETVREELTRVAEEIELEDSEIPGTIESGLTSGMQYPRLVTERYEIEPPKLSDVEEELLAFDPDDTGNAEATKYLYNGKILFVPAYGWMWWNGTHWTTDNEAAIGRAVVETLRTRRAAAAKTNRNEDIVKASKPDASRVQACKRQLQDIVTVSIEEFDSYPDLLNCKNGVIDLITGTLYPHSPEQMFTYVLPVDYDPDADDSSWTDFLSGVVGGGREVLDYLQMAIGYSFTGHTSEESLFYLYGPTRSGKGTFTETLMSLLPYPLAVEVDFNTFTAKREGDNQNFDLAPLKPARVVFASESNQYQTLNPAKIKALTGGNMVWCAFKHRDMFSYKPQYTVWLSSNHPVNGDVDDDALWYRVKVIDFPNSYAGREDKSLKYQLRTPEALQGVLRWVVEGAMKWYASEGLTTPEAVRGATKKHRDELDTVSKWLAECTEEEDGGKGATNEEIMHSYKNWCESNNLKPKSIQSLSTSLKARGYKPFGPTRVGNRIHRGFTGLQIISVG